MPFSKSPTGLPSFGVSAYCLNFVVSRRFVRRQTLRTDDMVQAMQGPLVEMIHYGPTWNKGFIDKTLQEDQGISSGRVGPQTLVRYLMFHRLPLVLTRECDQKEGAGGSIGLFSLP